MGAGTSRKMSNVGTVIRHNPPPPKYGTDSVVYKRRRLLMSQYHSQLSLSGYGPESLYNCLGL